MAPETGEQYDADNRLTGVGDRTLSYDGAGNLTADGPTSYTWNTRGQLTAVQDPTGTTTMGYGADGQLAKTSRTGTNTLFRYDA